MAQHVAIGANNSATTSLTIGALSGGPYGDGHTLVLVVMCSTVSTAPTGLTGWTLVASAASGSSGAWMYARKGDGTTNSVTMTLPGTGTYRAWLMAEPGTWSDQLFEAFAQLVSSTVTSQASGTLNASDKSIAVGAAQLSGSAGGTVGMTNGYANVGSTPGGASTDSFSVKDRGGTTAESVATTISWTTARNIRAVFGVFSQRAPVAARLKKASFTATGSIAYNETAALGSGYGHLLLVRRESTTPIDTPDGWTLMPGGGGQTGHNDWVYYKRGDGSTNSVPIAFTGSAQTDVVMAAYAGIQQTNFVASVDYAATASGTSSASASHSTTENDMIAVAFGSLADTSGAAIAIGSSYQTMFGWPTTSELFFGDRAVPTAGTAVGYTAGWSGGTARTGRNVVVTISKGIGPDDDGPGDWFTWNGLTLDPIILRGTVVP